MRGNGKSIQRQGKSLERIAHHRRAIHQAYDVAYLKRFKAVMGKRLKRMEARAC
jgi:hypothetical protein